jgi:Protein of unknown function (DUF429)
MKAAEILFFGVDFTSRPTPKKPIIRALARFLDDGKLNIYRLETTTSFAGFEAWLDSPATWVAGFDFPFSLPQEYIKHLGWPQHWEALMQTLSTHSREQLRGYSKAFCDGREVGNKFAHRLCDIAAGSSSSMKWVNPPVLYMLLEGAPRLAARDINVPGLRHRPDAHGTALEAYPGYLARALIGNKSYKSDTAAKQNSERAAARETLISKLLAPEPAGALPQLPRIVLTPEVAKQALADSSGDSLDAILCVVQAAMAWQQRAADWGMPQCAKASPTAQRLAIEGWIAGVNTAPRW